MGKENVKNMRPNNQHNYNYHTYGSQLPHLRFITTTLTVIK